MTSILYVVATPIGHLEDISRRALSVLECVDRVVAEDTRRTRQLLNHYGIATPLISHHIFNETQRIPGLIADLDAGQRLALVSDAGTPVLNDPGYPLVRAAHHAGHSVVPIPGPSSLVAALSVCGLPVDRVSLEGFLPHKPQQRRRHIAALRTEPRTMVFLESSHRIRASLADLVAELGAERPAAWARELTKRHETVHSATLGELQTRAEGLDQTRGEHVLVIAGDRTPASRHDDEALDRILRPLVRELPLRTAARVAAEISGCSRNAAYQRALQLNTE